MRKKHTYATGTDLQRIAVRMQKTGILCSEGLREFKKQFILTALKNADGNRTRAAEALGVHVNTLSRSIRVLGIDASALPESSRRLPPVMRVLNARNAPINSLREKARARTAQNRSGK